MTIARMVLERETFSFLDIVCLPMERKTSFSTIHTTSTITTVADNIRLYFNQKSGKPSRLSILDLEWTSA